ncbi:MAG: MmcQ/YjbR family DNA-binding protein [Crocinitomicaceae bacterium]|nr:MmcQ/YjbR family DNA-binding protein [Crocinitomicaceae bacterium]
MTLDEFVEFCISKPGVSEHFPFDENTLVFKVMGKMFALTDAENFQSINLKCEPEMAIELREKYAAVKPGYHMNKTHWNTIEINSDANDKEIYCWIDNSYNLILNGLTKNQKKLFHKQFQSESK